MPSRPLSRRTSGSATRCGAPWVLHTCTLLAALRAASAQTYTAPGTLTTLTSGNAGRLAVTLTVSSERVLIPGAVTLSARLYHVNGMPMLPGPTIRVKPGDALNVTLVNALGANSVVDASSPMNFFRRFNSTNLHTHGLHIDPKIDIVSIEVDPGQSWTYQYQIPLNHAPGMYWYHPHAHGSSTIQVMGGMFGALMVDPPAASPLPTWISAMTENVVVLHHMRFAPETSTDPVTSVTGPTQACGFQLSNFNPFKMYSFDELENEGYNATTNNAYFQAVAALGVTTAGDATLPTAAVVSSPAITGQGGAYFANGAFQPTFAATAGVSQVFRVAYAASGYAPRLQLFGNAGGTLPATGCTMSVIALDGIYLVGPPRQVTFVNMVAGSRADIVIGCSTAGTYYLFSTEASLVQAVLLIAVTGTTAAVPSLPAAIGVPLPSYLPDLTGTAVTQTMAMHFSQGGRAASCPSQFWMGFGVNCDAIDATPATNPSPSYAPCPFAAYMGPRGNTDVAAYSSASPAQVVALGVPQQLKIHGLGNNPHPVHIHVNHFQVISFTANAGSTQTWTDWAAAGDYRDTLPALNGQFVVRFVPSDFTGETVVHCHMLVHEDKGLMSSFLVVNASAPPSPPPPPFPPPPPSPRAQGTPPAAGNAVPPAAAASSAASGALSRALLRSVLLLCMFAIVCWH